MLTTEQIRKATIIHEAFLADKSAKVEHHSLEFALQSTDANIIKKNFHSISCESVDIGERFAIDPPFHVIDNQASLLDHLEDEKKKEMVALVNPGKANACIYDPNTGKFVNFEQVDISEKEYRNILSYLAFIGNLKAIADHYISSENSLVFFVPGEGMLKLAIPRNSEIAIILEGKDLEKMEQTLEQSWKEKPFQYIFKAGIISRLEVINKNERFAALISCLPSILEKSLSDYQIYLVSGSYKQNADSFEISIQKSFSEYRGYLEKLGNIVLSIPITFAGSIFAILKMTDNIAIRIVLIGIFIYAAANIIILVLNLIDASRILIILKKEIAEMCLNNNSVRKMLNNRSKYLRHRVVAVIIIAAVFIALLIVCEIFILVKVLGVNGVPGIVTPKNFFFVNN